MPTQTVVQIGAGWWFGRTGLEIRTTLGLPGTDLPEGTDAPLWTGELGVGFQYALLERARRVSVVASGGLAGLVMLHQENKKWSSEIAAVPYVNLGARVRIGERLAARIDGTVGVAIPEPEFNLRSGDTASFGRSVTQVCGGVELSW